MTPIKTTLLRMILILGLAVLLGGEAFFGYRLYKLSAEQEQIKEDYSLSNSITFGIFSVDEWRDKIAAIINPQIHDFTLSPEQKKAMQAQVEQALHGLVNKAVAKINKPQKTLGGKLKKLAFNSMVNTDDIQAQVPSFARTIIAKVSSPVSTNRLKDIASAKVGQLELQTYDSTAEANQQITRYVYGKYHVSNAADYDKVINSRLATIRTVTYNYAYAMLGCVLAALALWWLMRKQAHLQTILFVMSLVYALLLLLVGIGTAIVEVDARIRSLNFTLLGQKVDFENQVLFFQRKSLWGVVETLISQSKPDAIVVGSLILLFVIVLPVLRMIAKGIHIVSSKKFAGSGIVRYLAFEAAKWDMADVMVVGILMTYIGLNGILKSQLSSLNIHSGGLTTVTENNSSLQPGYIIFVGYVVYTAVLSAIFKRTMGDGQIRKKQYRRAAVVTS